MKHSLINSQAEKGTWKENNPAQQPKPTSPNPKHEYIKKAAPFIPDSYPDPTASAALRNLMREEERLEQKKRREQKRK